MKLQKPILFIMLTLINITSNIANGMIHVVAAENTYGEVAKELGGPHVKVTSILNNPSQDPHLFTTTPSTSIAVSQADIVIYNGLDYDPWMVALLGITDHKKQHIINISKLVQAKPGDNPHLWYSPTTIPQFAKNYTGLLIELDPQNKQFYEQQLVRFNLEYQKIYRKIENIKKRFQNASIISTEPLFNYMAQSLGLKMHAESFQLKIMNSGTPSISEMKSFVNDLRLHKIRVIIYNNQVITPLTTHILLIAKKEKIPAIGLNEMISPNMTYIEWMIKSLDELEKALELSTGKTQ